MYQNLLFQRFLLLNMFRATHRSSSGAQKLYLQPLVYVCGCWPLSAAGNHFCVVLCTVCFVSFSVLFMCTCICVLNYCHRVATQLQLNIYHIISYHISYHIIYHIISYIISYQIIQYHIIPFTYCAVLYKQTANSTKQEASFNVDKYILCQNWTRIGQGPDQ